MTDPEMHTLTGVYAADAMDASERASFESHLAECAACRAEVAELTETTSRLAGAVATPAPAQLRARVLAEAAQVRQVSPHGSVASLDERRSRRWYQQPASIAAALLLVVAGGLGVLAVDAQRDADRAEQRADQIAAIATDPNRVEVTVPVSTGGEGTVMAAGGSALFRTTEVAELPDDQVYQLWIIRDGKPQSAGVLGRGGTLEALVDGMRPSDALGLTVEPGDGSTVPEGELVLRAEMA
jgi:anti-sigma factor RsiW